MIVFLRMDIRVLETFVAVVANSSIDEAARRLNLTADCARHGAATTPRWQYARSIGRLQETLDILFE